MRKLLVVVVAVTALGLVASRTIDRSSIPSAGSLIAWVDRHAFSDRASTLYGKAEAATIEPACARDATGTGAFRVQHSQIIDPDGRPFIARGFNLYDFEMFKAAGALTRVFPGLNFVRINIHSYNDPASYRHFVDRVTAKRIVVTFENHPNGGGAQGTVYTGDELAAETAWYASMAAAYKNNPYVWFGTFNEPPTTGGSLSQWQRTTYDAIRGAGNNNPILLQVSGSRPKNLNAALDPSTYASMTNVIWDVHIYGYQSDFSTDPATVEASADAMFAAAQRIPSADGKMPVLVGEYGPSTDGTTDDRNGTQVVTTVINGGRSNRFGSAAWAWNPGGKADHLLDGAGKPTDPFGQLVQSYINDRVLPLADCPPARVPRETSEHGSGHGRSGRN
jgi:mannan endo-1,4-beta-mannosidase